MRSLLLPAGFAAALRPPLKGCCGEGMYPLLDYEAPSELAIGEAEKNNVKPGMTLEY